MKKVNVLLDNVSYKTKPKTKAADITNRLTNQNNESLSKEVTIEELASSLGKGKTAILATYVDKDKRLSDKNPIEQQQVLFLDIDNTDETKEDYTIEDMLKDEFILKNAAFFYKSFSHSEEKNKFRIAFILEEKVTVNTTIRELYTKLLSMYAQADQGLKNTNRLFFGGKSGYEVIDINNTLDIEKLPTIVEKESIKKSKKVKVKKTPKKEYKPKEEIEVDTESTDIYQMLRANNYSGVKQLIKERYNSSLSFKFDDVYSAINVLQSKIDMIEFLDLPTSNPFLDVLHKEENPSASVFNPILKGDTEAQDFQLYKVFSSDKVQVLYDLVNLISVITGLNSRYKAGKLLIELTGSELVDSGNIVEIKKSLKFISKMFRYDEQMKLLYTDTYKITRHVNHLIYEVINIMIDYTSEDIETGEVRVVNFLSHETLARELTKNTHYTIDKNKARRIVDALVFFKLIKKLKDSEIPENMLSTVVKYKKDTGNRRRSNVYELVLPKENYIEELEAFCSELVKIKFTLSSNLNGDFLYRYFGAKEVIRVFPQFKTHEKETLSNKIENVLSKDSLDIEKAATKFMLNKIDSDGYVLEKEVKAYLTRYYKKSFSEAKFKTVKYSIIDNYDIKRLKVNSELKEKFKMKNSKPNMFCYTK